MKFLTYIGDVAQELSPPIRVMRWVKSADSDEGYFSLDMLELPPWVLAVGLGARNLSLPAAVVHDFLRAGARA
jgi:hypothetical protein